MMNDHKLTQKKSILPEPVACEIFQVYFLLWLWTIIIKRANIKAL